MQARICLKVVLKSWDLDILVSTSFKKTNISHLVAREYPTIRSIIFSWNEAVNVIEAMEVVEGVEAIEANGLV